MPKELSEKEIGSYLHDITLQTIQGCSGSKKQPDMRTWSPNNVKRVFICPDYVIAEFHVLHKNLKRNNFMPMQSQRCVYSSKYVPMLKALVSPLVCSSIEEIIISRSSNQGVMLRPEELDFSILCTGTSLNDRFKRLRAIIVTDKTLDYISQYYQQVINDNTRHLADIPEVRGVSQIMDIHKNDWHKGRFLRKSLYVLDSENGTLAQYFRDLEIKIEESKRKAAIDESRDQYLADVRGNYEKELKRYTGTYRCFRYFYKLMNENDESAEAFRKYLKLDIPTVNSRQTIYDLPDKYSSFISQYFDNVKKDGVSKEDIEQSIVAVRSVTQTIYISFFKTLVDTIMVFGSEYPSTAKVRLNGVERTIVVPQGFPTESLEKIKPYFGGVIEGKKLKDSIANICFILCKLLFSSPKIEDYQNKEKWYQT